MAAGLDSLIQGYEQTAVTGATFSDPVDWIESHFYVPELNGPLQLHPYQRAVLREAYRTDENGHFVYSMVVWCDVKKSIKSTIAAAVCLHRASQLKFGSIKIIANDLKQADSRVAHYFRRALQLSPEFALGRDYKTTGYRTTFINSSTTVEAVPIDPEGEAGGNDDMLIFSELWGARHKNMERMWTESTLSPMKWGKSQRWVETYAGFTGESPILEGIYDRCVQPENQIDLSYDDHDLSWLEVYREGQTLCLWNTRRGILPWQVEEYYQSEAGVLTPSEFNRVHGNLWASSASQFVPDEWWAACEVDIPPLREDDMLVLAADAGVSGDCFALVGVTRHQTYGEDGDIIADITKKRYCRTWTPPKNGKIKFSVDNWDDPSDSDMETPEWEIDRLCKTHNVVALVYDEYQLHDMMTRIRNRGQVYVRVFSQGNDRLRADKQLHDNIRDRTMWHDGDETLAEHVKNANKKEDGEDGKLRIVKRSPLKKIDAAVALSMANHTARRFNLD